jgi:hypothetical protein
MDGMARDIEPTCKPIYNTLNTGFRPMGDFALLNIDEEASDGPLTGYFRPDPPE